MSVLSVVSAFTESNKSVAHKILSVGKTLADNSDLKVADLHSQATAEVESLNKSRHDEWLNALHTDPKSPAPARIRLVGFSTSTLNNYQTAFRLFVAAGFTVPESDSTTSQRAIDDAALIEDVRAKHGAKLVKSTIKEAEDEAKNTGEKSVDIARRFLAALVAVDADSNTPKKAPQSKSQRLIALLKSADTLALSVEVTDEEAAEILGLINNLVITTEAW